MLFDDMIGSSLATATGMPVVLVPADWREQPHRESVMCFGAPAVLEASGSRPAWQRLGVALLSIVFLVCSGVAPVSAGDGLLITIHAPHRQHFTLALDEIELDWTRAPHVKTIDYGSSVVIVAGTDVIEQGPSRVVLRVSGVSAASDLQSIEAALAAGNPEAEVHLILYEAGGARTKGTRRVLTREVGLLVEPDASFQGILSAVRFRSWRPVPGVAGAFVVDVERPLDAIGTADTLREQAGVQHAYPLLRRHISRR